MKIGLVAAIALSTISAANAQDANLSPNDLGLSPDKVRFIQVRLADDATGACWTNLQEVREYAEERLRIRNYQVVDNLEFWQEFLTSGFGLALALSAIHWTRVMVQSA